MTDRVRGWKPKTLVALAAIIPFLPSLRAQFIYDDSSIIRDNVMLRGWSALWRVWAAPYWPVDGPDALGLYRPLQLSLLSVVWNLSSGRALAFHIYALLLSMSVALAVWWILRRAVGAAPALIAAIWFATHPLHVETIASVANSSELIVVLCTIGMVAVLLRPVPPDARGEWRWAIVFGLLAAGALAAKESGLLATPLALLTAWGWNRDAVRKRFLAVHTHRWMAGVVGIAAVLFARLAVLGAAISHGSIAAQGLSETSAVARATSMLSLWPRIAVMLLWPSELAPYYGPTLFPAHRGGLAILGGCVAIALVALAIIVARRGERRPLLALAWIVLTYLPASNLLTPTGQILSDRTLFGATVGAAMFLALFLDALPSLARRIAIGVIALVIARSAISSAHYTVAWTSHRALWERLAEVEPGEHLSYKLLGMDARARGDTVRAVVLLSRALSMAPADRQIRFEYGQALFSAGRYGAAAAALAPLIGDDDARSESEFVRLYLESVGRSAGPRGVLSAALPLRHSASGAVASLYAGLAYEQLGLRVEAESSYVLGLRRAVGDSMLAARLAELRSGKP